MAICLSACSGGKVEDKYPGQPVKHRQESFKNILNAFEPLGLMRRGERKFDASTFQNSLQNLEKYSQSDELLWKYFDKNYFFIKLSPINTNVISDKNHMGKGIIKGINLV